jgi:hypothetical protein
MPKPSPEEALRGIEDLFLQARDGARAFTRDDNTRFFDCLDVVKDTVRTSQTSAQTREAADGTDVRDVHNTVTGGTQHGPVIQGRDFGGLHL